MLFSLCANIAWMVTIPNKKHFSHTHTYTKWIIERVGVSRNDWECTIMICIFCRYILLLIFFAFAMIGPLGACKTSERKQFLFVQNISGTVQSFYLYAKGTIQCEFQPLHWKLLVSRFTNERHNYKKKHLAWFWRGFCVLSFFREALFCSFSFLICSVHCSMQ